MSKVDPNPFGYKYDIGDTLEYIPKKGAKPRRAEVIGRKASEHPDNPGEVFDHTYVFDATNYLGDSADQHEVLEDEIEGKVK